MDCLACNASCLHYYLVHCLPGSIVGAVPPLMGWLAATHPLTLPSTVANPHPLISLSQSDPLFCPSLVHGMGAGWEGWGGWICGEPLLLSSLLLLWQFPHFFALCYMYKDDYKRGGFKMVSTAEDGAVPGSASQRVANLTLRYSVYLALVPPVSSYLGYTSYMYTVEATVLNAYLLYLCAKFHHKQSQGNARRIFLTSLWYLPLILVGFIFHSRIYNIQGEGLEEGQGVVATDLVWGEEALLKAKQYMKSICMHEQMHEKDHLCAKIATEKVSACAYVCVDVNLRHVCRDTIEYVHNIPKHTNHILYTYTHMIHIHTHSYTYTCTYVHVRTYSLVN